MSAYVMKTFQEDINLLDKLNTLFENVMIDYEYSTLVENTAAATVLKTKPKGELKERAIEVLKNILDAIKKFFTKIGTILTNMVKRAIGSNTYYIAKEDIEVSPYLGDKFPESICNKLVSINSNIDDEQLEQLEKDLDEIISKSSDKVTMIKGSKIDVKMYLDHKKKNDKYIKILDSKIKSLQNSDNASKVCRVYQKLANFLSSLGKDMSAVISNSKLFAKQNDVTVMDDKGRVIAKSDSRKIYNYNKQKRDYDKYYGIKNESVTKNEYIASIMLEAAELLKNDNYSDISYFNNDILTESISYTDSSDVYLLTEAADEINDITKITNEVKKDKNNLDESKLKKISQKIKKSIDNLLKWYYKIEPNKKFKALHTVLYGLESALNVMTLLISLIVAPTGVGISTGSMVQNSLLARSINKQHPGLIGDYAKEVAKESNKPHKKILVISLIAGIISTALLKILTSLRSYSNEKFNVPDCEANIKSLKKQINKIDEQIKKCDSTDDKKLVISLQKMKKSYTDCLGQFELIKEQYSKESKKDFESED